MKILRYLIIIIALACGLNACTKLDLAPMNIIQDNDVFSTNGGIQIYMARMYSELPIEDFRYSPQRGLNMFWIISPFPAVTGEALSRDQRGAMTEAVLYWGDAYKLIRETNYFLQALPKYAANFEAADVDSWIGEAHFIRAFTYFSLAKRYGGVPIVSDVLQYPTDNVTSLDVPRASEEKTYDFIAADLDTAIAKMSGSNQQGRATKYAAAAFKSRAMLYAGSIAKYNQVSLFDDSHNRLCGLPPEKANTYFKAAYDAAVLLDGQFSLYKKAWAAGDKEAQYQNYVKLFFDGDSPENIFVKQYSYPQSVHGYDAYMVPLQCMGPNGYSSEVSPTLNYVEMFDGLPKNPDGTIQNLDGSGKYILYDNTMDIFAGAEPRLRATVILPGDNFKGQSIEIRRGIYTGSAAGGISPLIPAGSTIQYPTTNIVQSANGSQTPYTLPNGTKMNPAGASGTFFSEETCSQTGFFIRKYLDESLDKSQVKENNEDQTWIEIRYAEVLLNKAEAAYELFSAGQTGANYQQEAFTAINLVRERAGADLLATAADLSDLKIIQKERRKELGFENKIWWDLKRWRILDKEQNNSLYRVMMPFYVAENYKYFFDVRKDEKNRFYNFDPKWYYEQIPTDEINKSHSLKQNPGY
ncbi:RagB/SusD family nutrient uptake outer membrane protein [Flavitalea sp. BT771]|uniref:RagB/SusD family nutrient uptake outer membrane protein n=1 Tax=Flavitalea sp. BT771 TaxID=3063329 RepID=UPI0026E28A61|nr:RagB/SusD family nutrient uptake outer membrane protein [Flavitalea sp. BT771]MDO6432579.1 RagB/SusD family nutrient uptake outer membrane protein [Flavitalea sp. BT771]MDV6222145.1 RagB/SusD family nutrient uptake outer membrane protein [Flavitalea sp. BT771]